MKKLVFIILFFLLPIEAFAKRTPGYVPPPYIERVGDSFAVLLPTAILFGLLFYWVHFVFDRESTGNNRQKWGAVILTLACLGSLVAGIDAQNDEFWNPSLYGGLVLGMIGPLSLFVLNHKLTLLSKSAISLFIYPLSFIILILSMEFYCQEFDKVLGWMPKW